MFILFLNVNAEEEVFDVAHEYNVKKNEILTAEKEKRAALGELFDINQKTKKIAKAKSDLLSNKLKYQKKIENLSKSIVGLEKKSIVLRHRLGKRLKEIYKIKGMGFFYALFSSRSIHDLDKAMYLMNKVSESDKNLQNDYRQTIMDLTAEKESLNREIVALEKSKQNIIFEESKIASNYQLRKKILSRIDSNIEKERHSLELLRHRGLNLSADQKDLELLFQKPVFEMKGKLDQPTQAAVTRDFSMINGLHDGILIQHKGWFYKGDHLNVKSIYEGQVVFNGKIEGYGNALIINHGDDYYSVYAHMKSIEVSQGKYVQRGEFLGVAGDNSRWSGNGLYFEIRHFSEPEDPVLWIVPHESNITEVTSK